MTVAHALARPPVTLADLQQQGFTLHTTDDDRQFDAPSVVAEWKYRGYLKRHNAQWARTLSQERRPIPAGFEYGGIPGLSREVVERLSAVRPDTLGHASRVPGVTPAALAVVAARLSRS